MATSRRDLINEDSVILKNGIKCMKSNEVTIILVTVLE